MTQVKFGIYIAIAALYIWGGGSFYELFEGFVARVAARNIYEASLDLIFVFFIFFLIPPRWVVANTLFFSFYVIVFIKHFLEVTGCNLVRLATEAHIDATRSVCEAVSGFDYWIIAGTVFGLVYAAWTLRRWYLMEYTAKPNQRRGSYMGFRKLKRFHNMGFIKTAFILIFPFSSMSARMHDGVVYSFRRENLPGGCRARHGHFVARPAADIDLDAYCWVPLPRDSGVWQMDEARAARGDIWSWRSNCVTAICIPHYAALIRAAWENRAKK